MQTSKLITQYNNYLINFNKTGEHPHPSKLLALLLLPEKDNYLPWKVENDKFYHYYKKEIDEKIEKIINDFQITKEEMIYYVKEIRNVNKEAEKFEPNQIWLAFIYGIDALHWGILYHYYLSPEKNYEEYFRYWEEEQIYDINLQKKLKRQNY